MDIKIRGVLSTVVLCAAMTVCANPAFANLIYHFDIFNSPQYASDPSLNFTVTVTDHGYSDGRAVVGFKFSNNGTSESSSITAVYFDDAPDDNLLFEAKSTSQSEGVSFSPGARPKSLPAGNELNPPFDKKPEYTADSDAQKGGTSKNGINPNEWFAVVFELRQGQTFTDVVSAIEADPTGQISLRMGLHIQSVGTDGQDSVSAINQTTAIPEPVTLTLLVFALAAVRKNK